MSIKIDLMPRYVALQKRFKSLLWGALALLAATASVLAVIYLRGEKELAVMKEQASQAQTVAAETKKAVAAQGIADSAAAQIQPYVQYVVDVGQTGAQRAALLDLVRRYITPDAIISQIDMSDGSTAKITATLRSPNDYARFLLSLRAGSASRGGALFTEDPKSFAVLPLNSLPGTGFQPDFATPAPTTVPQVVTYPITMTVVGTLKDKIVVPAEPGTAVQSAANTAGAALTSATSGTIVPQNAPSGPPTGGG